MDLKTLLVTLREGKGLSLRQVSAKTGGGVSAAYLSQLENGEAQAPSPSVLHKLAKVYGVEYMELMKAAGYVKRKDPVDASTQLSGVAWSLIKGLTPEEKEKVLEYIKFITNSRKA